MAFSLTGDAGCETGGGVSCLGNHGTDQKQSVLHSALQGILKEQVEQFTEVVAVKERITELEQLRALTQ